MDEHTRPDDATRAAERDEAAAPHVADRAPTEEEAEIAESLEVDPEVAAREREMAERGAEARGEGRIP